MAAHRVVIQASGSGDMVCSFLLTTTEPASCKNSFEKLWVGAQIRVQARQDATYGFSVERLGHYPIPVTEPQ